MKLSISPYLAEIPKYIQATEATYVVIVLIVLFIGYGISLSRDDRKAFKSQITRLPVVSIFLLLAFILSLYNQLAAALLIIGFGIILLLPDSSPTLESFKNKETTEATETTADDEPADADADEPDEPEPEPTEEPEDSSNAIVGGGREISRDDLDKADEDETPKNLAVKPREPTKNYLSKSLGMHENKYGDMFNAAVQENKKAMRQRIKTVRNNNKRHESSNKNSNGGTKGRENYSNTGDLSIPRRKFNLNEEVDKDLLNTREICTDIINRVNYEYEDKDYLKKYIAARVEEIIEINKLLDD